VARAGNDLYATHDGNVYRNTGSGWQEHSGSGWTGVSESTRSEALNRESQIRSEGQARVNDFRASGAQFGGMRGGGFRGGGRRR
jgi:hypothetical protein